MNTLPGHAIRGNPFTLALLLCLVFGIGAAVSQSLIITLVALGSLAGFVLALGVARHLRGEEFLAFSALLGHMVLNYGFANWSVRIGDVPLPIGHLLAFSALGLALLRSHGSIGGIFREPAIICVVLLLALSLPHLLMDFRRYGAYALRDTSFVVEGLFLVLGIVLARHGGSRKRFTAVLGVIFLANFLHALTFPVSDLVRDYSPASGIFLSVPVLGNYRQTAFFLVAGACFFLLTGRNLPRWQARILGGLAILQIAWSFFFQLRSAYIGIFITVGLVLLFRGWRRGRSFVLAVLCAVGLLFSFLTTVGTTFSGRKGPMDVQFFGGHVQSLVLAEGAPAVGSARWRLELLPEVWERWTAHPSRIFFGEGFGEPLIDHYRTDRAVATRQPHNTHLSVLLRLGLLGFLVWAVLLWRIFRVLLGSVRAVPIADPRHGLRLWFLLFFLLGLFETTVQPWLEFSYGAIPFFLLAGFGMAFAEEKRA